MAQNLNLGMKCIKYMLFISNFMFVMVGVLLISFGTTIKSIYANFELFMEDHYFSPAILTVAIGVIILLIAAFGCAAALKESTCMVNMYALLLLLALILEVSASIAAYSMRSNIELYMEDRMTDAMSNYYKDSETRSAVDDMQSRLNCCGVRHEEEWYQYNYPHNQSLPNSCCNSRNMIHYRPWDRDRDCYTSKIGCLDILSFIITQSTIMLGSGALCIALVQILGIVFAIMLAKSIRRIKTERAALSWQSRQELYLQLARGHDNKPSTTPVTYTPENQTSDA